MMSVSGVRGVVGESLTPTLACELGCAFGTFLGGGKVVIGRDSRPSGLMVQQAVASGLMASGCEVVTLGIASTPATAMMVRRHKARGGIVITASHNPIIWNGIKFLTDEGLAPPPEQAKKLFDIYQSRQFHLRDAENAGQQQSDPSANATHVDAALALGDRDRIASNKSRVVLDSINGAGGTEGKQLLAQLGCELIHMNAEPTGRFAHTPEPTRENLSTLCEMVQRESAQVGFAQDPDADRLAIVDETGSYIGEEYTLALAAKYMFTASPGPAAANLSTSRMIDDLAAQAGGPCCVYRSPVGEANVVNVMRQHGCGFGGEGNGGIIDLRVGPVRDSLVAMVLTLQLMAETQKTLSQLVAEIPSYVMIKEKVECPAEKIAPSLEAVKKQYASQRVEDSDGVRVDFDDGWVHVRASNTEPIVRIISEGQTQQQAENLIQQVHQVIDTV
jgi:phosphomannomutase